MNNASEVLRFAPWLGGLLALVCLLFALRSGKRKRLVDNLPTSKTTGVFIGLVELKGTAESAQPLTSYLAGQPCVHYQWRVGGKLARPGAGNYTTAGGEARAAAPP